MMNRKAKVVDLLTLIRRKTKYPAKDLLIYKISLNDKNRFNFNLMDKNSLNKEVHQKNYRPIMYYVCHQEGLPILQEMTEEQK